MDITGQILSQTKISLAPAVKFPDAPVDVYIRAISDTQITVHWEQSSNNGGTPITGYSVQWSTEGDNFGLGANNAFVSSLVSHMSLWSFCRYKVQGEGCSYNHVGYSPYTLAQLQFQWQTVQTVSITSTSGSGCG